MPGYIDTAKVLVLPDLGRFQADLKKQLDTAFQGVKRDLNNAAKAIEQPFTHASKAVSDSSADAMNAFRMATAGVATDAKKSMSEVEKTAKDTTTKSAGHFVTMRSRVRGALSDAFSPLRDLGPKVSSSLTTIGTHVDSVSDRLNHLALRASQLSLIGVGAFTALGGAAAFMGIKTLAAQQNAAIGFEVLVGSTDKAQKLLRQLFDFAKITPFELPQVQQAAQLLLGAGSNAGDLKNQLTALGNAASVTVNPMDSFGRITLALSQAMNRGKLQGQDLLQVVEAGVPVWRLLSEALHKPIPEIQKLSEQGKLLSADVMPKLFAQMNKDYGGAMTKQSQTLTGMWSTFMDTLNFGLADVVRPFQDDLNGALAGAIQRVDAVTGKLADKTSDLHKRWTSFKKELPDIWARFKEGIGVVGNIVEKMGGLGGVIRQVAGGILALNAIKLGALFGPWGIAIGIVVGAVILLWTHFKTVRETAMGLWRFIQNSLSPAFDFFVNLLRRYVAPQLQGLIQAWRDNSGAIKGLLSGPVATLLKIVGVVLVLAINILVRNITGLITIIGVLGRGINFLWTNIVYPVTRFIVTAFLTMAGGIIHAAAIAFGWVPGLGPKLKNAAKTFDRFKDDVNKALDKIKPKSVWITGKPALVFSPSFTQKDWVNARLAAGRMAVGGLVRGPGGPREDRAGVYALSNREYVHTARATNYYGVGFMDAINKLQIPRMAGGGLIPRVSAPAGVLTRGARDTDSSFRGVARIMGEGVASSIEALFKKILSGFATVGGNLGQWIAKALLITGTPASWGPAILRRIMFESGGNPRAINLSDINAQRGDPSRGLMQTIMATFRSFHQPGTSWNIYDPVANIAAAIRYIKARYRTIFNIDPPVRGYAQGLWKAVTDRLAMIHRDEMVIPAGPANVIRRGGGGGGDIIVNFNEGAIQVIAAPGMDERKIAMMTAQQIVQAFRDKERDERRGPRR